MTNTEIYTNKYGMITTNKLNKIIDAARKHTARNFNEFSGKKKFCDFLDTKRMRDLANRFQIECDRIKVNYEFGDCLA